MSQKKEKEKAKTVFERLGDMYPKPVKKLTPEEEKAAKGKAKA